MPTGNTEASTFEFCLQLQLVDGASSGLESYEEPYVWERYYISPFKTEKETINSEVKKAVN